MSKKHKLHGFRSDVGAVMEKGHNNGSASNIYRERNTLKGIIEDKEFMKTDPVKWKRAISYHAKSIYEKIESGRYRGERGDYEILAEATQICQELVYITLWAICGLIRTAKTPELCAFALKVYRSAEAPIYKYGSQDDRAEWKRIGSASFAGAT